MSDVVVYGGVYLLGVIISSFSQILLKKSANEKKNSLISQYLNPKVIIAYSIFFIATFLSLFAYKVIPITLGSILGALEYGLVAILSSVFFHEKLNRRQLFGIFMVIIGIIIYSVSTI